MQRARMRSQSILLEQQKYICLKIELNRVFVDNFLAIQLVLGMELGHQLKHDFTGWPSKLIRR